MMVRFVTRHARHTVPRHVVAGVLAALVLLAGCGGDDAAAPPTATAAPTFTLAAATTTATPVPPTPTPPAPTATAAPPPTATSLSPTATATPEADAATFFLAIQLPAVPAGTDYIQLERVVRPADTGADAARVVNGVALIYQDVGSEHCVQTAGAEDVTITHAGEFSEPMSRDAAAPRTVVAGDGYLIDTDGSLTCTNDGSAASSTLSFVLAQGGAPVGDAAPAPGLLHEVLSGGAVSDLPAIASILTFERTVVPPSGSLAVLTGYQAVVFVEDGSLNLRPATGGEIVTRALNSASTVLPAGGETDLIAGDGAVLAPNSTALLRNLSPFPTTVLVATIQPTP